MRSLLNQHLNKKEFIRIIKFGFTGLLNAGFGFSVYIVTFLLSENTFIALLVANILGVLFNFFSTGKLVFDNTDPSRLTIFVVLYLILFVINFALLKGLLALNLGPIMSQAFLIIPMAGLTYVLQRLFVFKLQTGKDV